MSAKEKNINNLKKLGFLGVRSVKHLIESDCENIPNVMGVYVVFYKIEQINFLNDSIGGHFKGKNPTVSINKLSEKWVDNTPILYIGKAGGFKSNATLKKRIKQYIQFGNGQPVGHWGGRLIWQIKENRELLIAYKSLSDIDPREYEKTLLNKFFEIYGKLPFANLKR